MEEFIKVRIEDYSHYPGPRYVMQGPYSGEDFYHTVLNEKFKEAYLADKKLEITLDGVAGYATSFFDESFGNLIYDFGKDVVINHLIIISNDERDWIDFIFKDVMTDWEIRRINGDVSETFYHHKPWFRLVDNKLENRQWILPSEQPR